MRLYQILLVALISLVSIGIAITLSIKAAGIKKDLIPGITSEKIKQVTLDMPL